ncbi:MAG: efflux RND transporter periplasmic adaptor subunit [Bacteroidales bacterium]
MRKVIFAVLACAVGLLYSCNNANQADAHGHNHAAENNQSTGHEGHDHSDSGHDHGAEARATKTEGEIELCSKQMFTAGIRVKQISPIDFYSIIPTSGSIESIPSEKVELVALHDGRIQFQNGIIVEGQEVTKNTPLLILSGSGFSDNNFNLKFNEAKLNFQKLKRDYDRAKDLHQDKIISDKDFLVVETDFKSARKLFMEMKKAHSKDGVRISAPINGYITEVLVKSGEYVTTGQALLRIQKNNRLLLKADLPQKYWKSVKTISSANFKVPTSDKLFSTESLDGKFISSGKNIGANKPLIPVYFEMNNHEDILPGTFCKAYLKTESVPNSICVLNSSLIEEMGHHYVYIRLDNGNFKRKEVIIGDTDGKYTRILKGLKGNERVVYRGAFQVKMASMSSAIPHGHAH